MSLEFVIIPLSPNFEQSAYDIKTKLISYSKLPVTVDFDLDYNLTPATKIMKWKKKDYDIITIDQDFLETNSVIVRFSDKGSKPKPMELDEFLDLVASFEHDDEIKHNDNTTSEDNNDDGCSIM